MTILLCGLDWKCAHCAQSVMTRSKINKFKTLLLCKMACKILWAFTYDVIFFWDLFCLCLYNVQYDLFFQYDLKIV